MGSRRRYATRFLDERAPQVLAHGSLGYSLIPIPRSTFFQPSQASIVFQPRGDRPSTSPCTTITSTLRTVRIPLLLASTLLALPFLPHRFPTDAELPSHPLLSHFPFSFPMLSTQAHSYMYMHSPSHLNTSLVSPLPTFHLFSPTFDEPKSLTMTLPLTLSFPFY